LNGRWLPPLRPLAAGRGSAASVRFATMTPTAPVPRLEPAFDVTATLGPLEDHGTTRAGHRRVVPITGGLVSGLVDAEILAGGADWQLIRPDGATEIDTRYSARTPAGEYVHFRTAGVRSGPPEILDAEVVLGRAAAGRAGGPVRVLLPRRRLPGDRRAAAGRAPAVDLRRLRDPRSGQRALHGLPGHLGIPRVMHPSASRTFSVADP
jgi:hypothetical protein